MLEGSRLHVAVDTPAHTGIGEPLTYLGESRLAAGTLVRVPLGRREVTGIVWDAHGVPEAQPDIELKSVLLALESLPPLPERVGGIALPLYTGYDGVGAVVPKSLLPAVKSSGN